MARDSTNCRGVSVSSPQTVLTKRLGSLEERGLLIKKKIPGQRGFEYFPTEPCKELLPVIRSLGDWGMRWARKNLSPSDYDVDIFFTTSVKVLADVWMGDTTYRKALASGDLLVSGPNALTRDIASWMANSDFSGLPPARDI